jgi:uncharacterized protein
MMLLPISSAEAGQLFGKQFDHSFRLFSVLPPGIYGAINPGITLEKSLFKSKITGSELITGGHFGPGNSIQATIFCLIAELLFLWLAKRKNNFIKPYWKK